MTTPASDDRAYEPLDADATLVTALASGIFVFVTIVPLVLTTIYPAARERKLPESPQIDISAPRLQTDPRADLADFRRTEDERLASYGRAEDGRRTLRMPIERAMALIVARGLPGWPAREMK